MPLLVRTLDAMLPPVSLSTTVDFSRDGEASSIRWLHSSSLRKLWRRKARGSQDTCSILPFHNSCEKRETGKGDCQ